MSGVPGLHDNEKSNDFEKHEQQNDDDKQVSPFDQ